MYERYYYTIDRLFDPILLSSLTEEATAHYELSLPNVLHESSIKERGGKPRRKYRSAEGGSVQASLYHAKALSQYLEELLGEPVTRSGEAGSFSYYCEEGDHLDIHRDIEVCDLTLITALKSNIPAHSSGGTLNIFTGRTQNRIDAIYQNPTFGYESIALQKGQSVLLRGGIAPHAVNPLLLGEQRIISALCFRVA